MPLPEKLRAWLGEDRWNYLILTALMDGAVAGAQSEPLGESALKLGYAARTAQGDAFEAGHEYGSEHRNTKDEAGEGGGR